MVVVVIDGIDVIVGIEVIIGKIVGIDDAEVFYSF